MATTIRSFTLLQRSGLAAPLHGHRSLISRVSCSRMATSHASPSTSSSNSNDFEQTRAKLQTALIQSTNIARLIPPPDELRYSRTLSRPLGKKVDQASKRLLHITSRVLDLAKQAESDKGKQVDRSSAADLQEEDVVDAYQSKIVQVTDQLLEQIDKNLDEAFDSSKKKASKSNQQPIASTSKSSSSKDPSQSTTYRDAGDIRKPQLDFNEGYDTSRTAVFTPLLPNKPHAIEPLDFTPTEYDSETSGKTRMRIPNPYAKEIQAALEKPFPSLDNPYMDDTAEKMSSQMDDKPYLYVDTTEKLAQCLSVLKDAQVIAVDLEHHDLQSYRGITCLIQVSSTCLAHISVRC